MFLWFSVHLSNHPAYAELSKEKLEGVAKSELAAQLWEELGEAGVLFRAGELFAVATPEERASQGEKVIYLRASFSSNSVSTVFSVIFEDTDPSCTHSEMNWREGLVSFLNLRNTSLCGCIFVELLFVTRLL